MCQIFLQKDMIGEMKGDLQDIDPDSSSEDESESEDGAQASGAKPTAKATTKTYVMAALTAVNCIKLVHDFYVMVASFFAFKCNE